MDEKLIEQALRMLEERHDKAAAEMESFRHNPDTAAEFTMACGKTTAYWIATWILRLAVEGDAATLKDLDFSD